MTVIKLIRLWPSIKQKIKINLKIILHCHYTKIKIDIKRILKNSKSSIQKLSRVLSRNFDYLKTINYLKEVVLQT